MPELLNRTKGSVQDLALSLACARDSGRPYTLADLEASLDDERRSVGARKTVIALLEREIKRQRKAAA
ncbi:hypothetical protein [Rhodocyclus tenuis]|uniref:Uncharacterized protein n=1 Tax=Rhodocyclus tenuis TaxID=1066 RepID=A0A840GGE7_RHOTE|nr:hypothetical protein [Rhodocyclus tenuis]MBB4247279.1 hypothetical protein [Rhodocyclus tenuis]